MKKVYSLLLVLFLGLAFVQLPVNQPVTVEAAAEKSGLKKESGKYYYYVNGKKAVNTWKTVSGKKYYFGSNGAAYAGTKTTPALKKIGSAYYAFDVYGRAYCSTTKVIRSFQCKFAANGMLTGVVNVSGNYYYYEGTKRAKNAFKTATLVINGKTYKYQYYFGSNYAAVKGSSDLIYGKKPLVKKIGGVYYGFDENARMLTGTQVIDGKFYVFGTNGKYNSSKSTALRKYCVYGADTQKLLALLGKPKKTELLDGCMNGQDINYHYTNFVVSSNRDSKGKEIFLGIMAK